MKSNKTLLEVSETKVYQHMEVSKLISNIQYPTLDQEYTTYTDELAAIDKHIDQYNAFVESLIISLEALQSSKQFNLDNLKSELASQFQDLIWIYPTN